jgi:hypothetical protein
MHYESAMPSNKIRSSGLDATGVAQRAPRAGSPLAGDIYAFRTTPVSEFAPPRTGRFAAFKVIGSDRTFVVIAVLDGVWRASPTLEQARETSILREHRFACNGFLAVFGMNADWWAPSGLAELVLLGSEPLSPQETDLAAAIARRASGSRYSTMQAINHAAEAEWRWSHDRQALLAEHELEKEREAAVRLAREERYRTRLRTLTWSQLLAETPFQHWSPSPPYPPPAFTAEAGAAIRKACEALSALGPRPRRADARTILKACVQWFNEADERAGRVIETEEREDICAVLGDMAYVARQRGLVDEIDQWRDW